MLRAAIFMAIGQAAASFIPAIFPKPTSSSDNDLGTNGWSPKPTNALLQPPGELKKRQGAADTCGYISGNGLQPLTCASGYICVVNTSLKAAACCVDLSCNLFTACLPKVSVQSGVLYNSRVGICTQGSFTNCQTKAYNYGAAGYFSEFDCGVVSTYIIVSTTSTFTTSASTTPVVVITPSPTTATATATLTKDGSTVISISTSVVTAVTSVVATSNAASESTFVVHTQIVTVGASSGGSAAPPIGAATAGAPTSASAIVNPINPTANPVTTNPVTTSSAPAKPFPVGAAVGGAVGGLAVIGAAVAGIIFLFLRNKKKNNNAPTHGVDNMADYNGPAGPGPGPQVQQSYYPQPPPAATYQSQQPPQGYPQPPPQIYQQGHPQNHPQGQAELAAFAQNDPNKGFNQPGTQSFSPPLSPAAPPYPPSQYNSSPPLGNAVEIDPGRPARRSELY